MNVFYEPLPDSVTIDGRDYPVITDFREWIRFSDMLKSDISINLKIRFLTEMFVEDVPDIYTEEGLEAAINGITEFLSMEVLDFPSEEKNGGQVSKGIYYEYDAPYIISAFMRDYGIDLLKIPYLHWWEFRMLLDGLDEKSQIKERIYYRTVDLRNIKDKEERKHILKIRRLITIPDDEYVSDGGIGNAFV